jgi:hypothetical protein
MAVGERSEATLLMSLWWDHAIGVAPICRCHCSRSGVGTHVVIIRICPISSVPRPKKTRCISVYAYVQVEGK